MVIVNIGGEGEVPGAINVNSLIALRRPLRDIVRRGLLIQGDFARLPLREGCADEVVGNHIPLFGDLGAIVMREVFRVLRPNGNARVNASAGDGVVLLEPMRAAGFAGVTLAGLHALGRKP